MNELANLEREVEMARARLAGNLSTLVSTDTYSELKEDVRDEARSAVAKMVENLKARAAANPAAALAIGAGLTWRLLQRPPITAALIGAGVISLLRTTPISSNGHERDYLSEGKERLKQQVGDLADSVKDQAAEVADAVREQVSEFAEGASEKVQKWSADAATGAKEQVGSLSRQAFRAADDGLQTVSDASSAVRTKLNQPDVRDNLLLGVAGAAVAAALGIAYQRRNTWDE
jgi:dGTP triphosphohydrolase